MTDTQTLGTIEHIDPNQIEVETNVRTVVKIDPSLVASIREFGVLEPVVCRLAENGTVSVRMGQRPVLAAREAERPSILLQQTDARKAQRVPGHRARAGPAKAALRPTFGGSGNEVGQRVEDRSQDGRVRAVRRQHHVAANVAGGNRLVSAGGIADAGLLFRSFQRSLRTFVATQQRLDEVDALSKYVTPTGSSTFAILPGFDRQHALGASLARV